MHTQLKPRFLINIKSTKVIVFILMNFLFSGQSLYAEAVKLNIQYLAGSQIDFVDLGVSFTLPNDVHGVLSPDNPQNEFIVVLNDFAENGNNGIYLQITNANLSQMAQQMNGVMNFKGTQLHPIATTQMVDGAAYNEYEYSDDGQYFNAFMLLVMLAEDNAVLLLAASPQDIYPSYKQAVIDIAQSIHFNAPMVQHILASANNEIAENLAPELIGAWMNRRSASNGIYIESTTKWVFSGDGSIAWGSGAVIAGGTAGVSLRGGGDNPPDFGRWTTEGETLRIQWDDGTQGEWIFSVFDYDGRPALALKANGESYYYKRIDW